MAVLPDRKLTRVIWWPALVLQERKAEFEGLPLPADLTNGGKLEQIASVAFDASTCALPETRLRISCDCILAVQQTGTRRRLRV